MQELILPYVNAIGIFGVSLVLTAYYLLNINKFSPKDLRYLILNFSGSSFILFSLAFHWNLSSVVIESIWILISIIGIYRVLREEYRRRKQNVANIYYLKDIRKLRKDLRND